MTGSWRKASLLIPRKRFTAVMTTLKVNGTRITRVPFVSMWFSMQHSKCTCLKNKTLFFFYTYLIVFLQATAAQSKIRLRCIQSPLVTEFTEFREGHTSDAALASSDESRREARRPSASAQSRAANSTHARARTSHKHTHGRAHNRCWRR